MKKERVLKISIDQVRKELAEAAAERISEEANFFALEGFTGYNLRGNEEVIDEYHNSIFVADNYDRVQYFTVDGKFMISKEVVK